MYYTCFFCGRTCSPYEFKEYNGYHKDCWTMKYDNGEKPDLSFGYDKKPGTPKQNN